MSPALVGISATLLLTLPALWLLFKPGFFVSDDGRFHVYRIAALARAWEYGVLYPRLFPEFGFGYGQAVLNFYAPLSYVPGALLSILGIGPAASAEFTFALGFVLAALAAYGYARSLWGSVGGVLAAVAYTYFPYHLADVYLRGALPEHFAFIWPPLILWTTTLVFRAEHPWHPLLWGALTWTGLVYTHNLTALLMIPAWSLYVLTMAFWTRRLNRLPAALASVTLALGLSAPLWLPFLVEQQSVGLALGPSDGYKQHLTPLNFLVQFLPLYRYRLQHGGIADHPLSWLTVLVLIVGLLFLILRRLKRCPVPAAPALGFGLVLMLATAFMITTASLSVWQPLTPVLGNLQYPWRFLVLTAAGWLPVTGALPTLIGAPRQRGWGAFGLGILILVLIIQPLANVPLQRLDISPPDAWSPVRMWREDAEVGQVGATWTGEFLPLTVKEQRWALGRPRDGAQDGPALPQPQVRLERVGYDRGELTLITDVPLVTRLHQFHLPAWQANVNGERVVTFPTGEMGLVSVSIVKGEHRIAFQFGPTLAWLAGAGLGLLACAAWLLMAWRVRRADKVLRACAVVLLIVMATLTINCLGFGKHQWTPQPLQTSVGDVALLIGYDAAPARGADALDVTLYWFALRDVGQDYKVFVHLLGPDGKVTAQHDGDPVGGFTPTSRWRQGEIIVDRHQLLLPLDIAGGTFRLKAGMYQPEPFSNLPLTPATEDGRVELGEISLR